MGPFLISTPTGCQEISDDLEAALEQFANDCGGFETNRLQAETDAELDAYLPTILNSAFKGEL